MLLYLITEGDTVLNVSGGLPMTHLTHGKIHLLGYRVSIKHFLPFFCEVPAISSGGRPVPPSFQYGFNSSLCKPAYMEKLDVYKQQINKKCCLRKQTPIKD